MISTFVYIQLAIIAISAVLFVWARVKHEVSTISGEPNPAQKAYIMKGEVKSGDLVPLLPFWLKQGLVNLRPDSDALVIIKQRELADDASEEQVALFQTLFMEDDVCKLCVPQGEFKKNIHNARDILINSMQASGVRIFTKASTRSRGLIRFLLLVSIVLYVFTILQEILRAAAPMEPFVLIISSIIFTLAIGYCISAPASLLARWGFASRVKVALSVAALIAQYLAAFGATLFIARYIPSCYLFSLSSLGAYVVLPLLFIFTYKRTEIQSTFDLQAQDKDILFTETRGMYPDPPQCDEMYRWLKSLAAVWDYSEVVKVSYNYFPHSVN